MADQDSTLVPAGDVDMEVADDQSDNEGLEEDTTIPATQDASTEVAATPVAINPQQAFLNFLRSPVIQLSVGEGSSAETVSAHRAALVPSPFFAEQLADPTTTALELPDEHIDAVGCFLQYQYTGEYFPRRLPNQPDGLENDPSLPTTDETGEQLLKHARVYTLAEKLGLPALKSLAHSKIHRINSSAKGEIAYARYVYQYTSPSDVTIRKPVAAFWATRSHVLRHEAEEDFRDMCLEFPQFGFDVLSLVLDAREKRARDRDDNEAVGSSTPGTQGRGRKRMRASVNV